MLSSTLLATLALAATGTLALPLEARQSPTCVSGLYIIVARGSGEDPGEGEPGQVADMIVAEVPGSTSVAVDYPATLDNYASSVTAGINDAKKKVQAYVNACGSSSRVVLIGYSQGGEVMTDLLAGGVDKPAPLTTAYSQYVTAVTVFGDPTFTAGQSFDAGSATKDGIFARSEGGSSLARLNTYAKVVRSYCDNHDTFCASGDSLNTHYAEVSNHAQQATDFVVSLA